jgi:autotransporter-associated beta strand protein
MDGGALHVGSGGLGSGSVMMTNPAAGSLVFNPAGTLQINNPILGSNGMVLHSGSGTTFLNATSTYSGQIVIEQGTLAAGSTTGALGATNATTVLTGATLDVNARNLQSEHVRVSGAGVNGNGAIVNNSTNASTSALRFVTLSGDTTFGGIGRWDIRGAPAALLSDAFAPVNITKKGTNQISLVAITNITPDLTDIDIQEGTFAIQTSTIQVGDPNGTINIHPGAALNFFNLATPLNKNITLQSGGTITNESGTSTIVGPLTVSGNANISAAGVALVLSNNVITGTTTTFTKAGGGSLRFVGNALPGFNTLSMLGGTLDLTEATVQNIALGSGQTLNGNGTILGNVNGSGAAVITVTPSGTNLIGRLSVSNSITLPSLGQTLLDIAASRAVNTNSDTIAASSIAVGGTLIVSNVDGALTSGMSFQLFDTPSYTGSFTSIQLPALTGELEWENTLSTDGRITVIGDDATAIQTPRIVSAVRSGSNLIMSGTNGTTNGTFYVITSTNIALPLTNWSIVSTSTFGADGSFSVTNAIDTTKPRQFFDLLQQVP